MNIPIESVQVNGTEGEEPRIVGGQNPLAPPPMCPVMSSGHVGRDD